MGHETYPSELGLGTYLGFISHAAREFQFASWGSIACASNQEQFIYSGFGLAVAAGLSVDIAEGIAVINGRILKGTTTENFDGLANAAVNYIFIQPTLTADVITGFTFIANTTGIKLPDAAFIGCATTAAGATTSVSRDYYVSATETRHALNKPSNLMTGSYIGNNTSARTISTESPPRFVMILQTSTFTSLPSVTIVDGKLALSGLGQGSSVIGFNVGAGGFVFTSTDLTRRPELTPNGFMVGDDAASGMSINYTGFNYVWWAWR